MIRGPFITPHAVAQFRERIAPLDYEAARDAILDELEHHRRGQPSRHDTGAVTVRTRGGRYPLRAVLMPPLPGYDRPAVVTILRSGRRARLAATTIRPSGW